MVHLQKEDYAWILYLGFQELLKLEDKFEDLEFIKHGEFMHVEMSEEQFENFYKTKI